MTTDFPQNQATILNAPLPPLQPLAMCLYLNLQQKTRRSFSFSPEAYTPRLPYELAQFPVSKKKSTLLPDRPDMLCQICLRMLRGQVGKRWGGTHDLFFDHHESFDTLKTSHAVGCGICRALYEELMIGVEKSLGGVYKSGEEPPPDELENDQAETVPLVSSTALLGLTQDIEDDDVFRLDFKLECFMVDRKPSIVKKTFVLKQIDNAKEPFRTAISAEHSSSDVFKLALSWITFCNRKCNPPCVKQKPIWYPTRLIDIRALKSRTYLDTRGRQFPDNLSNGRDTIRKRDMVTVKLVERSRDDPLNGLGAFGEASGHTKQPNSLYVTLSHCWGQFQPYTLRPDTAAELKAGIEIERLPKTFRDAINFASQLHNVGWIWIDSLCIYQGGPDFEKDWLHEADLMQSVYRESYLNISATAASNSGEGLYTERDCRGHGDEVDLEAESISGLAIHEKKHLNERKWDITNPKIAYLGRFCWKLLKPLIIALNWARGKLAEFVATINLGSETPLDPALPEPEGVRRYVLIDTSCWDSFVNKAPISSRAWVLQERLLAPRVLHFCKNSIAWECAGLTTAEGHPTGLPMLRLQHDKILPEVSLKGLDPLNHGKELREIRLRDAKEPDPHISKRNLYGFELWARVVETYSRMNLTVPKDKLIALSGIAYLMSTNVLGSEQKPAQYVAGLWRKYLESQLLWRVEPIFVQQNRTFQHPGRRPEDYRAPSFSWASVDAQKGPDGQPGSGITYGEMTDRDLLIDIQVKKDKSRLKLTYQTGNTFGLVTSGHIMVYGKLRKIKLSRGERGRFFWRLLERNDDKEEHYNVYLDAPDDDEREHGIFDSEKMYCMPAAFGPRSEKTAVTGSRYMICLILQQADDDEHWQMRTLNPLEKKATFRRIGITKLSGWADKHTSRRILDGHAKDMELPHWPHEFDDDKERHLIRII